MQTRSVQWWRPIKGDEGPPLDEATGVVGTPFTSGLPLVETQIEMMPYNARGFMLNPGEYQQYGRSDATIMECLSSRVGTLSSSTCEAVVPDQLTAEVAKRIGIDRDTVARRADEFNIAFGLGKWTDKAEVWLQEMFLSTLTNGFSVFEIMMKAGPDVRLTESIVGIAPRQPQSMVRWIQDYSTGAPLYIQQTTVNGYVRQPSQFLDLSRCIFPAMNRMGDNFEGISGLRACRAWDLLTTEVVMAVVQHVQRFGMGIPILKRKGDAVATAKGSTGGLDAIAQIANFREAAMELGSDVDVEILQMQLQNANVEGILETCTKMKRSALNCSVLGIGDSGGSYNLADVRIQQWLKEMHATAAVFEAAMNRLIRYWIDNRYGRMEVYPVFSISGFASRSAKEMLEEQQLFVALSQKPMTDAEIASLAARTDVDFDGRNDETQSPEDEQTEDEQLPNGVPVQNAAPGSELPPPDLTDKVDDQPPKQAAINAAHAIQAYQAAPEEKRGLQMATDLRMARKIAGGKPLTSYELNLLRAWFETNGDPTLDREWTDRGPSFQDYMGHGGDEMREWLTGSDGDIDGVDAGLSVDGDLNAIETSEPDAGITNMREAHRCGPNCGHDHLQDRARKYFTVPTRTGTWRAWRELKGAETSVAWEQIEQMREQSQQLMTRAIERSQRTHRTAFMSLASPLVPVARRNDPTALATLSTLSVDWIETYENAILEVLERVSQWASKDMAAEIADAVGDSWVPVDQQLENANPDERVKAFAKSVAVTANDRMNEKLRRAVVAVANGGDPDLASVKETVGVNRSLSDQFAQSISETINQTRQAVAMELGPEAVEAQFSALMDKWTCEACAEMDLKTFKVGSSGYLANSPPYPKCASVANSKGQSNLCHCIWVYMFRQPAPAALEDAQALPGLQVSPRSVQRFDNSFPTYRGKVTLLVGLPGAGKSTLAESLADESTVVVDRDDFVLTPDGYDHQGRVESVKAMAEALENGNDVVYVACLLSPDSRQKMVEAVNEMTNGEVEVDAIQVLANPDHIRKVNADRADEERGNIPPEQLEHVIDAWSPVDDDEPFSSVRTLIV